MDVHDVVEVPPPRHLAPRALALGGLVARVGRLAAAARGRGVDRHRPRRAVLRAGGGRSAAGGGKVVQPEVVDGPGGVGDLQVGTVPSAVGGPGQELDLGAVVVLQPPSALRLLVLGDARRTGLVVGHKFAGVTTQREGQVGTTPALVTGVGDPCLVARLVGAFDEAGAEVPAVTDPRRLGVGGRRPAVDRGRVVAEGELGCPATEGRRRLDRIVVGEGARGAAGGPGLARREGRGAVGPLAARREALGGQEQRWRRGGLYAGRSFRREVRGLGFRAAALRQRTLHGGQVDIGDQPPRLLLVVRRNGRPRLAVGDLRCGQRTRGQRHQSSSLREVTAEPDTGQVQAHPDLGLVGLFGP